MTITYLSGTLDTTATNVGTDRIRFDPVVNASSAVGDVAVIQVLAYSSSTSSADTTITWPAGFTEIGRVSQVASGTLVIWCIAAAKILEAGDIGSTLQVDLGQRWRDSSSNASSAGVRAHTFAGAISLNGTVVTDTRAAGSSGTWAPTLPVPDRLAWGVVLHSVQVNMASPLPSGSSWTSRANMASNAAHILTTGPTVAPLPTLTLNAASNGRCTVAFCVTDVPDTPERRRAGMHLGLVFGGR